MNSNGKIFIGGIGNTTSERLKEYFSKYGVVSDVKIIKDKTTQRCRGFGFITFENSSMIEAIIQEKHDIDGRNVEAKHVSLRQNHIGGGNNNNVVTQKYSIKKIFVGGLPNALTEDEFRNYFQSYGNVTDVVIISDQNTNQRRGFGFVTFDSENAVNNLLLRNRFHTLVNKIVEVKAALSQKINTNGNVLNPQTLPSPNSFYLMPYDPYHHHPFVPGSYFYYPSNGYSANPNICIR